MAERQSAGVFTLRSDSIEGLRQELNFVLQHIQNQLDQVTGNRGVPTLRANLNMTGKRIESLGAPTADDHAVPAGYALTRASTQGAYDAGQVGIQNLPGGINQSDAVNLAQLQGLRTTDLADFIEAAQDAVGAALTDTATVDFTYTDASNQITADVPDDAITNAKLRNSAAVSVIGRSANSTGDPADIAASANGNVLRRAANVVGFGQVDVSDGTNAVTGVLAMANGGTGSSSLALASGVFTPTLTGVANVAASTAYECQYMQVGATVTASGKVSLDPTLTATVTQLGISLPLASNIGTEEDVGGVAFASGIAGQGAAIRGDAANDRAELVYISTDITNQPLYFTFTYQII